MDDRARSHDGRARNGRLAAARKPPVPLAEGGRKLVTSKAPRNPSRKRLIVAMTGATGSIYGLRILEALRADRGWETHLIVSDAGMLNAWQEYRLARKDIQKRADVVHNVRDVGASVASGSFITEGMGIPPCSMKTLSRVGHAFS